MGQRSGPTLFELAGIGVMSAFCIAAGTGGGYWIAEATGAGAAVIFVGISVGIAAAVAAAYVKIKRYL